MKKLLFIRHGATAGNLERRYIGYTDEPLCDLPAEFQFQRASFLEFCQCDPVDEGDKAFLPRDVIGAGRFPCHQSRDYGDPDSFLPDGAFPQRILSGASEHAADRF